MSTPRAEGAVICKHFKPQNTGATHGETALRTSNPCPLVRNQGQKSPNPGLKCEQTWSCSGEPAGRGVPKLLPSDKAAPKFPSRRAELGCPSAPERQRQLPAGSARPWRRTQGSLFYLLNRSRLLQAALIHDSVSIDTYCFPSTTPRQQQGWGGAGSDTKSRAQGLLPDSFSL